jgi:hypothetical protein
MAFAFLSVIPSGNLLFVRQPTHTPFLISLQPPKTTQFTREAKGLAAFGEALSISIWIRYTLKLEPQPQVDFTCGFSNLNPAASSVST